MVGYVDKMFPTQPFFKNLADDPENYEQKLAQMLLDFSANFSSDKFTVEKPPGVDIKRLTSTPAAVAFLSFLIRLTKAKSILEVGTLLGSTTMHLAVAAGDGARVTTIEKGPDFAGIAARNFLANDLAHKIELIVGDGKVVLPRLAVAHRKFDFIFLDGGKQDYLAAALDCERLLSPHGLLVVDDVFFHGDALNAVPGSDKGRGCRDLLTYYKNRKNIRTHVLAVGNGMLLLSPV
jgi:predicted O-methyltransferase YrrM